jgi:outer membrane protein OmpA-like peptidoglycan-associated protein
MKRHSGILAGTALGLLMASAPLSAAPLRGDKVAAPSLQAGIILAQANCAEGESAEGCAQKPAEGREKPGRKKPEEKRAEPAGGGEAAPAAEPEQKPRGEKRRQKQAEPAGNGAGNGESEMAPAMKPQEKPHREKRQQRQAEPTQNEEAAPAGNEAGNGEGGMAPTMKPRKHEKHPQKQAEPAQNEEAAPAGNGAGNGEGETAPAMKPQEKPRKHEKHKPAEATQPAQSQTQNPTQGEAAPNGEKQAEPQTKKEKLEQYLKNKQQGGEEKQQPAQEAAPKAGTSGSQETEKNNPAETGKAPATGEMPAGEENGKASNKQKLRDYLKNKQSGEQTGEPQQPEKPSAEKTQPTTGEEKPGAASGQKAGEQAPATEQSQGGKHKATQPELPADTTEQVMPGQAGAQHLPRQGKRQGQEPQGEAGQPAQQGGEAEGKAMPHSDSAAQRDIGKIGRIESVDAVQGKRIDARQWREESNRRLEERRQRDKIDVVKQFGDRVVVKYDNNIYVDNRDANRRLERDSRDTYVEQLPRDFTRTTIVRDDGTRIVTIRNADGDILRRSRITPDNREVVLYYVPEDDYDRVEGGYADAGADLPPFRLDIPEDDYILDAREARPDDYYTFLDAPPVEPIERIYSVDEVLHSERIRQKVRRVDLDTITFDTGSADVGESQISRLEAVGEAMSKILKQNPAETFLIEGHTDAVGSDESNLVLSDERAESVAEALTKVFNIPPENLVTQGYGEKFLKVNTQGPNRENRRVTIRRITPLVSPVASAR